MVKVGFDMMQLRSRETDFAVVKGGTFTGHFLVNFVRLCSLHAPHEKYYLQRLPGHAIQVRCPNR